MEKGSLRVLIAPRGVGTNGASRGEEGKSGMAGCWCTRRRGSKMQRVCQHKPVFIFASDWHRSSAIQKTAAVGRRSAEDVCAASPLRDGGGAREIERRGGKAHATIWRERLVRA